MPAPSISEISTALLYPNNWWGGAVVTFSVAGAGSTWPGYTAAEEPSDPHYSTLNAQQAGRFAAAAAAWDAVAGISLVQTNDASQPGQIRVAFTDVDNFQTDNNVWGYAQSPPFQAGPGSTQAGDIWIDDGKAGSSFAATGYDYMATLHELGHALGLKHPFEDGATLPAAYDSHRYTVMSYTESTDDRYRTVEPTPTGIRTVVQGVFPSTPMVYDIVALQARYGADPTTAAGDNTYTWAPNTPMMQAIYDAGGVDTFDLSGHGRPSIINLTPGAYSSIDYYPAAQQAADWTAQYPWAASFLNQQFVQADTYTWSDNLGIAYTTVIENVVGGSGSDSITGNDVANNIGGRLGNDSIDGGAGDDYLRGDEGADRIVGGAGFDDINGNMGDDTGYGGLGPDWVVGGKDQDLLFGEDGDDIVYGNIGADTGDGGVGNDLIRGGQDNDSLTGGAGDDWISGDRGADTVSGGSGADIFHSFSGAGVDRVLDFSRAEGDRVQLDPGTTYAVSQSGADTLIDLGNGDQMILVGVSAASLTAGWIFVG
jgi:serralysin